MRRFFSLFISMILLFGVIGCFTGCDLSALENSNKNDNMNNSDRYDGLTVILNGHVEENNNNNDLVTPCCFYYDHKAGMIETYFWDRIPNDTLGLYDLPRGYHYLVIGFGFINRSRYDENVNYTDFQVYADNLICEDKLILNDRYPYSATISSGREGIIYVFYSVPVDAETIEIEYKSSAFTDTLVFEVQENGEFTDDDIEAIDAALDRLSNGEPAQIEETEPIPDPNAPITIISGTSDSCYHSNSANRDYSIELTYDGNYQTSWQDGSEGDAVGETLTYNFESSEITRVEIVNGNRKDGNSYMRNNRLASVTITFILNGSQVYEEVLEFTDDVSIVETVLNLDSPVTCDSVVLTINEVFPGSDYSDTGIAEVMFYTN